uniref:Head-to-tail connector protein n=1 Tax=Mycobacterium phage Pharb TaxID=3136626 RepID=A0AAU8GPI1_9VIRU
MPYQPLDMPFSEHDKIRNDPAITAAVEALAKELAAKAGALADDPDGYTVNVEHGTDRVRATIHAESAKAIHAEIKNSPLMTVRAGQGPS